MSARETILGRVRAKLPKGPEGARREAVELHMAQHPRNLIPARGQGDIDHRIRVFTDKLARHPEQLGGRGALDRRPGLK